MENVVIRPNASILMESTRSIGYSTEAAVADLIDNSISAFASQIDIYFCPTDKPYIAILDNGKGMSDSEINDAMRYGTQYPIQTREQNDLGRFGLGLKTASLSQCRELTVVSKQNDEIVARRWDLDYIRDTQEWTLLNLDKIEIMALPKIEELQKQKNGTLIIWRNLDRLLIGNSNIEKELSIKMQKVKQHIALIFHRYISGEEGLKKIIIRFNKDIIQAQDPYLKSKSFQIMDEEPIMIGNEEILVTPYILPHPSNMSLTEINQLGGLDKLRNTQGFYIYRNKRLIVWGTWFRLTTQSDLSKLARVMVDIPNSLDELWNLDIKKSEAKPPKIVTESLARIVEKIAEGSRKTWKVRSRRENRDDIKHVWNVWKDSEGSKYYEINRDYPVLEEIREKLDDIQKKNLENFLKLIENNIPLNTLRIDLNNDVKLAIEDKQKKNFYIAKIIKELLRNSANMEETKEQLAITEPFLEYRELIESIFEEVKYE